MSERTIAKSLNKAYRQVGVDKLLFDVFKQQLSEAEKKQIKERLKIKKDAKTIVFVGRLDKTKGISVLLKAIQKMKCMQF